MEIKKNKRDIESTNEVLVFCEKYICYNGENN